MSQCITGAIKSRSLAVPQAENTLDLLARIYLDLLRAEYGSCGQIFIHRRQKLYFRLGDPLTLTPQLKVNAAKWRAAVTGHESGGVQPGFTIASRLIEQHAHQRLGSAHKYATMRLAVAVGKLVGG
jgi:hypothetical protein